MASGMKERMQWSIDMQKAHALRYYRDYWDNIEEIDEVDDKGEEIDEMKRLDFSGIDKIIYTPYGSYQVAQRFRRMRNTESGLVKPDFSLRIETYNDRPTEYQKLKKAHDGCASSPELYGFGITPFGRQVARNDGFKSFYLIDMDEFLKKHFDTGEIEIINKSPNGDGSMGAYFSLDQLKNCGCVIEEWPKKQTRPENPHDITEWADDDD